MAMPLTNSYELFLLCYKRYIFMTFMHRENVHSISFLLQSPIDGPLET